MPAKVHPHTERARHRHDRIIRERGEEIRVALNGSSIREVARRFAVPRSLVSEVKRQARYSQVAQKAVRSHYSEAELIAALRLQAKEGRLSQAQYERRRGDGPSVLTFVHRFGSWNAAVSAAELQPSTQRGGNKPSYDDAAIREALVRCATDLGRVPSYLDYRRWAKAENAPSVQTIRNRKGRWLSALEDAGF